MASIPNVGPPVAKNLTDSAKKRFRREQNKAEIFKTKATSTKELRLTHAGLDKILLDRFDLFFFFLSFKLVLCMFIFKNTIILNTISCNIATNMILTEKKTSLVLNTQEMLSFGPLWGNFKIYIN